MMQARRNREGYTLIELMVVLAVLGVLASMAVPLAELSVQRQKEQELKRALWEIRDGIDAYQRAQAARSGGASSSVAAIWPPNLAALAEPMPDPRPGRQGEVLRFLRRIPRDPFADPALPADKTWGLRSYHSEAERPQAGTDVYDVYSRSPAVGLNGVPVRQW